MKQEVRFNASTIIDADSTLGITKPRLRKLGLELPRSLDRELANIAAETTLQYDRVAFDADTLADALGTAVAENRDPLDDPTVQLQLQRKALQAAGVLNLIDQRASFRRVRAILDAIPALINLLKPVFSRANGALAAAREIIPELDLVNPASIAGLVSGQVQAWGAARAAYDDCNLALQTYQSLAGLAHISSPPGADYALVLCDASADDIDALTFGPGDAWPLPVINAGLTLDLADFDQLRQRVKRVQAEREQRATEESTGRHQPNPGITRIPMKDLIR